VGTETNLLMGTAGTCNVVCAYSRLRIAGLKDDEGKTTMVLPSSHRLEKATDAERQLPSGAQELFFGSPELSFDWREFHPTRFGSSESRPDSGEESSDSPEWKPDG
jgi:hypothetical protein